MVSSTIVDRMRTNLAAAGIRLDGSDLDALLAGPYLESVVAFDKRATEGPEPALPDYLGGLTASAGARNGGEAPAGPRTESGGARPAAASESLETVAERVAKGAVSPVELTRQALDRIAERDPVLNAFQLVLADRAMETARRAEAEIGRGECRGPLHGVPIAVKDLMAMAGTPTTAGSTLLAGADAELDSAAVERLERAGAIIVGKTRMSEFAYLPGSANAHYGATRNPRALEHDAGGSSSGSAAAVADGLVFGAIGSDTGGSIRVPAALCGIVGLKPTFGRTSLHGVVPLSWSLDHLGPLTRTVRDAGILLGALAGADPRDTRTLPRGAPVPLLSELETGVRGLRIGVPETGGVAGPLASDAAWAAARRALAALEGAGAELVPVHLPELEQLWVANNVILAIEAAAFHQRWLQTRLAEYGEIPRRRLLAAYAHAPTAFVRAQRMRAEAREKLRLLFERVDLLGMPTQADGAPLLGAWGATLLTGPFNALGWPALTVPAGETADGLPLALQLVGRPWEEGLALRAGRVVEDS
ncbi:MAG: amidase [Gemmatimonadetes bacterium]|nr:amidase [Gemmatimonadota bacterium]